MLTDMLGAPPNAPSLSNCNGCHTDVYAVPDTRDVGVIPQLRVIIILMRILRMITILTTIIMILMAILIIII